MKTLTEKVILVTGASRGIGAAVAKKLASEGAKVVINYAGGLEAAEQTVNEIKQQGGDAIALQADVSKSDEVKAMFDAAIAHYGKIDVLVNNAGIMITKLLKDTTDEDFTRQFDINVRGTFNTLREAATKLADNGSVINFSSTNNRIMMPTYSTYAANKISGRTIDPCIFKRSWRKRHQRKFSIPWPNQYRTVHQRQTTGSN
jgi:3-oxoacyl-[acyl-carrier protein] reductase